MQGILKYIRGKNFQSHKEVLVEFVPGVNVILGSSNVGKTALLRLLKLIWKNRPLGFRYHSHFAGKGARTEAEVAFTDSKGVEYSKGKTGMAEYRIDGGEPFSGLGKGVPDKVAEVLNLTDTNIQEQLEEPFLITSTAGDVAKAINKITRLDRVDAWMSKLTTKVNSKRREIETLGDELKENKGLLEQYEDLPKIEKLVGELVALETEANDIDEQITSLEKAVDRYGQVNKDLEDNKQWLAEVRPLLRSATEYLDRLGGYDSEILLLEAVVEEYYEVEQRQAKAVGLVKARPLVMQIKELLEDIEEVDEEYGILEGLVEDHREISRNMAENRAKVVSKGIEYDRLYKDAIKSFSVCPGPLSCKLDDGQIEKLLEVEK